jgi:DedD protein
MDKALKQRLVGASVLIALAVIVLPMLLSGQTDNPHETRSIEVPPKPSELSFETRRFPLGNQDGAQPSVVETDTARNSSSPVPGPVAQEPDTRLPAEEPGTQARPADASDNRRQAGEPGDTGAQPGRYLVQVASFSTTANANRLASRLRDDGMSVMMDTIETAVGTLHRVRVGPFDQVEGASAATAQIRSRTPDVNPRIIDLRPDESAPVTDPSDPLVRWVVQVGSFSEKDNADSLVDQLRSAGFSAYTVTVNDPGGIRYKVRVGPEIERQSAIQIAAEIRDQLSLDGIVMSVD